jgi:hypothetical protein
MAGSVSRRLLTEPRRNRESTTVLAPADSPPAGGRSVKWWLAATGTGTVGGSAGPRPGRAGGVCAWSEAGVTS